MESQNRLLIIRSMKRAINECKKRKAVKTSKFAKNRKCCNFVTNDGNWAQFRRIYYLFNCERIIGRSPSVKIAALGQSMRHQIAGYGSWKTLVREGLETGGSIRRHLTPTMTLSIAAIRQVNPGSLKVAWLIDINRCLSGHKVSQSFR